MKKYFITIISITFFALFDCKGSNQEKKNEQILYVKVNELLVRENSDR
ncbi:MAG: hypothetical protein QXO70_02135 [Candidatus Pacearchaeota archaeon]